MQTETELAKDIRLADKKAKLDAVAKRLLSHKEVLGIILDQCVSEFKGLGPKDIARSCIAGLPAISKVPVHREETDLRVLAMNSEDVSYREGTVRYDILFQAGRERKPEMLVNLEIQNDSWTGYPLGSRQIYYGVRLLSGQHGIYFTGSNYQDLRKVYTIWINTNPPKNSRNTIHVIDLGSTFDGPMEASGNPYDLLCIIEMNLGSPEDEKAAGVLRFLDVLFSTKLDFKQKQEILQNEFNLRMTKEMEEEMNRMGGYGQGIYEEGKDEGKAEALRNLMKNLGWSLQQAFDALSIPESDQPLYKEMLGL